MNDKSYLNLYLIPIFYIFLHYNKCRFNLDLANILFQILSYHLNLLIIYNIEMLDIKFKNIYSYCLFNSYKVSFKVYLKWFFCFKK